MMSMDFHRQVNSSERDLRRRLPPCTCRSHEHISRRFSYKMAMEKIFLVAFLNGTLWRGQLQDSGTVSLFEVPPYCQPSLWLSKVVQSLCPLGFRLRFTFSHLLFGLVLCGILLLFLASLLLRHCPVDNLESSKVNFFPSTLMFVH